ncbi:hypothetical protein [Amycolatopsis rifamycinica]|uniref:hypothetical protein n=1 Tax=Amycolatopsis rifamycinica TaxID=287986 RepID=UPI00126A2326|nr:hypothetical protein [Amycolatopsis rifamycinica]
MEALSATDRRPGLRRVSADRGDPGTRIDPVGVTVVSGAENAATPPRFGLGGGTAGLVAIVAGLAPVIPRSPATGGDR